MKVTLGYLQENKGTAAKQTGPKGVRGEEPVNGSLFERDTNKHFPLTARNGRETKKGDTRAGSRVRWA